MDKYIDIWGRINILQGENLALFDKKSQHIWDCRHKNIRVHNGKGAPDCVFCDTSKQIQENMIELKTLLETVIKDYQNNNDTC